MHFSVAQNRVLHPESRVLFSLAKGKLSEEKRRDVNLHLSYCDLCKWNLDVIRRDLKEKEVESINNERGTLPTLFMVIIVTPCLLIALLTMNRWVPILGNWFK